MFGLRLEIVTTCTKCVGFVDPDSTTIPYLTALGDLSGTGLLALGFFLMFICGGNTADLANNFEGITANYTVSSVLEGVKTNITAV